MDLKINQMDAKTGRMVKEDSSILNVADKLDKALQDEKYKDLGQVISATNMAAGSTIYSSWFDNVQWVRNSIWFEQSDQQYDTAVQLRDGSSNTNNTWTINSFPNQASIPNGWRTRSFSPNSPGGALGYSARYSIKNSSLSANTFANLRVQLLGL